MEVFPESFNLQTIQTAIQNNETEYQKKQLGM